MNSDGSTNAAGSIEPRPGELFLGRFRVDKPGKPALVGMRFSAVADGDDTTVEIHWVPEASVPETATVQLEDELKTVAQLRHKNLVPCLGAGRTAAGFYVVNKAGQGRTLVEHLQRRFDAGRPFALEEAFNLFTHVCKAFVRGAEGTKHGLLRPRDVVINRNGRVQVAGFGWRALRSTVDVTQLSHWDRGHFADSIQSDEYDVSSLGFLAVQLLTNAPHPLGLSDWRETNEDTEDGSLLRVVDRLLAGEFSSIIALRNALKPAFGQENEMTASMNAMDVMVPTIPPPERPQARLALDDVVAPKDTDGLDDSLRWLVERDGIDFGPYSGLQIKGKLEGGELTPNSVIEDVETEERRTLGEFEAFQAFLAQWAMNKADRDEAHQTQQVQRAQKVSRRVRVWGSASVILVIVVSVLWWHKRNADRPDPTKAHLENLVADLSNAIPRIYPEELEPEGEKDEGTTPQKSAGRKTPQVTRRGGGCSASETSRRRKEAAMAASSTLGDQDAGRPRFSDEALGRVLSRYSRRLERCVTAELRRNPKLARMEILGTAMADGPIYNVRMPNVSKVGDCCVWRALRGAKVPKFAGTNREISIPLSIE